MVAQQVARNGEIRRLQMPGLVKWWHSRLQGLVKCWGLYLYLLVKCKCWNPKAVVKWWHCRLQEMVIFRGYNCKIWLNACTAIARMWWNGGSVHITDMWNRYTETVRSSEIHMLQGPEKWWSSYTADSNEWWNTDTGVVTSGEIVSLQLTHLV